MYLKRKFTDFQRRLRKNTIDGRVDHLHGLKENVIIGRKIPVGTGIKPLEVEEEIAVPSEEDIAGL
ncbi:hypothetical protein IKF81_02860 [Candidatus Saccharibacteria bacterium]|nr:hypothetical protein [Candidatus Saccharibacteria bacterium]